MKHRLRAWREGFWRARRRLTRIARCLSPPALGALLHRTGRSLGPEASAHMRTSRTDTALYRLWIRRYEKESSAVRVPRGSRAPSFAILVVGGESDPASLERTLASADEQSYSLREIRVVPTWAPPEGSDDDAVLLFLSAGDLLAPEALAILAETFGRVPQSDLVYGDEDHLDRDLGRIAPHFKPDWNPELFWSSGYLGAAVALRRELVDRALARSADTSPGSREDLIARCVAETSDDRIVHVARILVHRAPPGSRAASEDRGSEKGSAAIEALPTEDGMPVRAEPGRAPGTVKLRWPLPPQPPKATLVILTRDGLDLLDRCLRSVREKTRYPAYDIVVVDHASTDPATLERLAELRDSADVTVLRREGPFNFAALNNEAARESSGELLVFLNNDVEILTEGWLREMASHALRSDVGAVGARLLYPGGRLQHGGILLGGGAPKDAVAGHLSHGLPSDDPGYFGRAWTTQAVSAVTAACLVLRRDVFEEVGGFDAEKLPVAFNDVDLCLRIGRTGRRIVWTPWAEATHHESATRGDDLTGPARARFAGEVRHMRRRWGPLLDLDPHYNPNLDPVDCDFSLAFPPRRSG